MVQVRESWSPRDSRWVGATAVAAVALTLIVATVPALHYVYRSLPGHVAMETAACIVAALAATLAFVRCRESGSAADALLLATLVLLATTNLVFSLVPALRGATTESFATWAPVAGRFLGGLGFLATAYAPHWRGRDAALVTRAAVIGSLAVAATIAVTVAALGDALPDGVEVERQPESTRNVSLEGHPVILTLHVVSAGAYGAAALGFLRGSRQLAVPRAWLASAMVLAAGARVNYFLYPSLYSEYVYVGDFLRVGGYAALLVGSLVEILRYERRLAQLAIFEERRRLARDLHDGLAQELAFITSQSRRLGSAAGDEAAVRHIVDSSRRALQESRAAISALMRPVDEPFSEALRRAAEHSARDRADVTVQAEPAAPEPAVREALLRIVGEATENAVRHGAARRVDVRVWHERGLRVAIVDDGSGFDPAAPRSGSFGLEIMRERAERIGGRLTVASEPGHGTRVEVALDD